jgi:hypothetical protein
VGPPGCRRRAAAQVASRALALWAALGAARAQAWTCAGDGAPTETLALSALGQAVIVPWAGDDVRLRAGDVTDGDAFAIGAARIALCGQYMTSRGRLVYALGYEPWNVVERATADAAPWGRLTVAELGFWPWTWLGFSLGVRKILFSYGHDEPLEGRMLPFEPFVSRSIAPDRRLGVTVDDDFGVAHIVIGVYEGARSLEPTADGGLLLAVRLRAEPIGPVGSALSTVDDDPFWRRRPRFGVNASILWEYTAQFSGYALGADIPFKWGPLGVAVEYLYANNTREQGPSTFPAQVRTRQGLWAGFALMMWRPYLELEGRYDWLDVANDPRQRFHAITVGATAYVYKTWARLQLAYTHKLHADRTYDDDSLLLVLTLAGSYAAR